MVRPRVRTHQAQLAVADELRAQTRAWRGAGGEEERRGSARAASLAEQGGSRDAPAARPGPRELGTRSLPTARRSAGLATLESSFSRLFLSDDPGLLRAPHRGPGCGLAPGQPGPDWVAPGSLSSLPARPGLLSPPGLRVRFTDLGCFVPEKTVRHLPVEIHLPDLGKTADWQALPGCPLENLLLCPSVWSMLPLEIQR